MSREYRIRKLKIGEEIEVQAESAATGGKDQKQLVLRSSESPRPELHAATATLLRIALREIEAPIEWIERARFRGLSVNYEALSDRRGAVVTMLVDMPDRFTAPLVINTPHLREADDDDQSGNPVLPADMLEAVEACVEEAERFLAGERAQVEMFPGFSPTAGETAREVAEAVDDRTRGEIVDADGVVHEVKATTKRKRRPQVEI